MEKVQLSRAQTLGLERLFKKVDVELLGFAHGPQHGDVIVSLTRKSGQTVDFTLRSNGTVRKPNETDADERQHIAG